MWWLRAILAQEPEPVPPVNEEPSAAPAEPQAEPQAEVPAPPRAEAPNYTEMLVTATRSTRAAELALDQDIRDLGYLPGLRIRGRTQYLSPRVWKPRVTVYSEGFVEVRGRRITPMAPISETAPVSATALPGVTGTTQSKRQRDAQEDLLRRELAPEVRDWQQAIGAQALLERQLASREACLQIWEGSGDAATRRAALAELWLNTSDSPEGEVIRGVILGFVDEVVQESDAPYSESELKQINAQHSFEQPFVPMEP